MKWFWPPVLLKRRVEIKSVEACLEQMRQWPKVGPKMRAAYPICYGALEGSSTVEDARAAFVKAAKEAKVLAGE